MNKNKSLIMIIGIILLSISVFGTQEQILIEMNEYVDQNVIYNQLKTEVGIWNDSFENQSYYDLRGNLIITNNNPNGKTISDIYIMFDYTTNITLPTNVGGRVGTWLSNDTSSGVIYLHIPELIAGENSTWDYSINKSNINPPLNFTSRYSDSKLLAGYNITVYDTIQNVFNSVPYQTNNCIYDINITQVTTPVNFSGIMQDYHFLPTTTLGSDATNVSYSADNLTQYWNTLNSGCLNQGNTTDINYNISTPINIPATKHFSMVNTTIRYKLNNTISHLRVMDVAAISGATINFEKKIMKPSHPILYNSNVTWNVTGYIYTDTNITYNLTSATFWVAKRNGIGGDPNTIDNDTINTTKPLFTTSTPNALFNSSNPWASDGWLFNYSDIPSPIVWMDVNFTIQNDGSQLINRSVTQNGNDIYIKELYLIIGYWLEINKNITAISNNEYHVRIDVHNKGNQVTPGGTVVTIYDFIPSNFNLSSNFTYQVSPWYTTTNSSYNIAGVYNGTLHQWALISQVILNTSFAQGPSKNENTTWSVDYNVTGLGDYTLMDVFVTGLDPQRVDGAGSTSAVIVNEVVDRIKSTEGIFAAVASVLLLLGLLL